MATNFVARDGDKLAFTAYIGLCWHFNGWEDRKTYTHTETTNVPCTSCKNFLNFRAVNHRDAVASLEGAHTCKTMHV